MSSLVNHKGRRCPHILFFIGGQMSEGKISYSQKHGEVLNLLKSRRSQTTSLSTYDLGLLIHLECL